MKAKSFISVLATVSATIFAVSVHAGTTPNILNWDEVVPGKIYRSGRPTTNEDFDQMKSFGIKLDIDLQGGDDDSPLTAWAINIFEKGETQSDIYREKDMVEGRLMSFLSEPLNSFNDVSPTEAGRIKFVLERLDNTLTEHGGPALVHCAHGVDRTGLVIALYRVRYQNWSIEAAHKEMEAHGHGFFNQIFTGELDEFLQKANKSLNDNQGLYLDRNNAVGFHR